MKLSKFILATFMAVILTSSFNVVEAVEGERQLGKTNKGTKGDKKFYSFTLGSLDIEGMLAVKDRLMAIEAIGGNPDETCKIKQGMLPSDKRAILRAHVDAAFDEHIKAGKLVSDNDTDIREDFRLDLSPKELCDLIGNEAVRKIHQAFHDFENFPVTWMAIRKTSLNGDKHIRYHQDNTNSVMHIWLNEEDDHVQGGNLVYLNRNGTTLLEMLFFMATSLFMVSPMSWAPGTFWFWVDMILMPLTQ